jgi:hypothetical protein
MYANLLGLKSIDELFFVTPALRLGLIKLSIIRALALKKIILSGQQFILNKIKGFIVFIREIKIIFEI